MPVEEAPMCLLCGAGFKDRSLARRTYVLQLLALVEHPDALPADTVLRLGQEIMALIRPESGLRQCEAVTPPEFDVDRSAKRR
jgi:hypothetical protein